MNVRALSRLVDREKSERPLFMPSTNEPRHTRAQKFSELITNLRTASRGKHCNLSGLFVVALHLRAFAPCRIPEPAVSHPIYPSDVGDTPDSPQSPLLPVYCIA